MELNSEINSIVKRVENEFVDTNKRHEEISTKEIDEVIEPQNFIN
jgi:hypothetical protein